MFDGGSSGERGVLVLVQAAEPAAEENFNRRPDNRRPEPRNRRLAMEMVDHGDTHTRTKIATSTVIPASNSMPIYRPTKAQ